MIDDRNTELELLDSLLDVADLGQSVLGIGWVDRVAGRRFDLEAKGVAELVEETRAPLDRARLDLEGRLTAHRLDDAVKAFERIEDTVVAARLAQPGFRDPRGTKAAEIEVEPRVVKGKPRIGAIVGVVKHPLADGAHGGKADIASG